MNAKITCDFGDARCRIASARLEKDIFVKTHFESFAYGSYSSIDECFDVKCYCFDNKQSYDKLHTSTYKFERQNFRHGRRNEPKFGTHVRVDTLTLNKNKKN